MSSIVGQKGQIVIEKPLRDALGLQPGYIAIQRLVDDHVELHFHPPEHEESLRGVLADLVTRSLPQDQWSEIREQAWAQDSHASLQADVASE